MHWSALPMLSWAQQCAAVPAAHAEGKVRLWGEFITELGLALVDGVQGFAEPLGGCSRRGHSEAGGDAIGCQHGFNLK